MEEFNINKELELFHMKIEYYLNDPEEESEKLVELKPGNDNKKIENINPSKTFKKQKNIGFSTFSLPKALKSTTVAHFQHSRRKAPRRMVFKGIDFSLPPHHFGIVEP